MLNIRDCPGRQVPDGAVYIGRTVSRAHLPGSKWGNPFKPANKATQRRTRSPLRCIGAGCAVSRSCWPHFPSFAAAIWSAGARRCRATAMCCWNSPTGGSAGDPTKMWEDHPVWNVDPILTPFKMLPVTGRLFAGKPNQKAAEVQTKYIIVDMYAKAIQGMDAAESVKAAHAELVTIYGA